MTVATEEIRKVHVSNGTTGPFNTPPFIENDDLLVIKTKLSDNVQTTLVLTTDYTVTGAGNPAGGSLTLAVALANNDYKLTIVNDPDPLQHADYQDNDPFPATSHESALDKGYMLIQRLRDRLNRVMKKSDGDVAGADLTLPTPVANRALMWNAGGNGLKNSTYDPDEMVPLAAAQVALADAARAAAQLAQAGAESAQTAAAGWATKTDGAVSGGEFSSKAYAIGGTGVTTLVGSAKEWAVSVGAAVIAGAYSAKEWAVGVFTRGSAGGGSAKDWATYTGGTVDDAEYSAKHYSQVAGTHATTAGTHETNAAISAAAAQAAADAVMWNDVVFKAFADSPITVTDADAGKLISVDTSGGNVVINLPAIASLTLAKPWSIGIKKSTNDANTVTVNRAGTDVIDGVASVEIASVQGRTLIPDTDPTPDAWTSMQFGASAIADGSITTAKLVDQAVTTDKLDGALLAGINDFRLTLTSGVPVTTNDVTGATTIYACPYKGNRIALYDGTRWNVRASAQFSLALGTLTSGKPYDVFCYDNAGVPTLEFLVWTNDTTRATALTYQDGVLVKSGDATRLYLATFRTTATTTTEDSATKRFLWNYYNRVDRHFFIAESTASWTYSTATYRQTNNSSANKVECVVGVAEAIIALRANSYGANSSGAAAMLVGIGVNSTSSNSATQYGAPYVSTASTIPAIANYKGYPQAGYNYFASLEYYSGAGAGTWYGAANGSKSTGMTGRIQA